MSTMPNLGTPVSTEELIQQGYAHDMAMQAALASGNPAEITLAASQVAKVPPSPTGSVLTRLRQELGISRVKPVEVEVAGFKWLLRPPMYLERAWAAGKIMGSAADGLLTMQVAQVAASIVAIDGEPVVSMFGVMLPEGADPFNPPQEAKFEAAEKVHKLLAEELAPQSVTLLIEKFVELEAKVGPALPLTPDS